jgi:DNA-binding response OmpR family regulator
MLKIYLNVNDSLTLESLKELLPQSEISLQDNEEEADGSIKEESDSGCHLPFIDLSALPRPMRYLDLLAQIENLPYSQVILFSQFSLNLRDKELKNLRTNETQRITEKECQLLHFFYQNMGTELSKEILLKEIWSYHPDAETHTLETHIYRLRQKLEEDPNTPQVLLNCKDGYWIQ